MKRTKCYSVPETAVVELDGQLMQIVITSNTQGQTYDEEPDEDEDQFSRGTNDSDKPSGQHRSVWDE